MKAIVMHEYGGPGVLRFEDVPVPEPAPDEVLIEVHASGVNPVDWKIRNGDRKDKFPSPLPLIPGWDVSGVIAKTGENVFTLAIGDEVYSKPDPTRNGTYAEYVVVKADMVGRKPATIDHVQAASIPLAALTAWQGLFDHGRLAPGQRVLIHAASGGVGSFAIQFAKWKGAYVIGTASDKNIDFVKQLGADEVIDYKNEQFEDKLQNVDLVLDTLGGDIQKRSLTIIKNGGRLVTTLKPDNQEAAKASNITIEGFMAQSLPAQLEQIASLIDDGKVTTNVTVVLPLEQAAEAQRLSEEGHIRGKIVLKIK